MRSLIVSTLVALPLALGLGACDSGDGGSDDSTSTGSGTEGSGSAGDSGSEGGDGTAEGSSTSGDTASGSSGDSDTTTTGDSDSSSAGDTGTTGDTGGDDQALCESTEGKWEPTSCGHYSCGAPPECAAIIPGCDCGKDSNFVEGVGCELDPSCDSTGTTTGGGDAAALCESTGGTWDELSCGDYKCGMEPPCDAIIPGCDCGAGANYQEGFGCKEDSTCP